MIKAIAQGTVHRVPPDLQKLLLSSASVLSLWEGLTPLARNEWICWVESVKKEETRKEHIARVKVHLLEGQRRPCCWPGCMHRKDKALSPSQRFVQSKQVKKS